MLHFQRIFFYFLIGLIGMENKFVDLSKFMNLKKKVLWLWNSSILDLNSSFISLGYMILGKLFDLFVPVYL